MSDVMQGMIGRFGLAAAKGCVVAAVGVAAVAVAAQLHFGRPDSVMDMLHPRRLARVAYAAAQQTVTLRHVRMYLNILKEYKSAHIVKDIEFGINGRTLDVYMPSEEAMQATSTSEVPAASKRSKQSTDKLSAEASSPSSPRIASLVSDTFSAAMGNGAAKAMRAPVVMFVYGGAWGTGDKSTYSLLAKSFTSQGYAVVIPNYTLFPVGNVQKMVEDVLDALLWIQRNADEHQLDPERIVLVGHSAGAHLCYLTMLNVALHALSSQHVSVTLRPVFDKRFSDIKEASKLLQGVKKVVGLAGVYDIADHYQYEAARGVEFVSPMARAMLGHEHFKSHSPTYIAHLLAEHHKVDGTQLPIFHLIHGTSDTTVPHTSSDRLAEKLGAAGVRVKIDRIVDASHSGFVLALMEHDEALTPLMRMIIVKV